MGLALLFMRSFSRLLKLARVVPKNQQDLKKIAGLLKCKKHRAIWLWVKTYGSFLGG